MKKLRTVWVLMLLCCGIVYTCYAQVLLTPQIPPQGLMQKKQLWNMLIINNSGIAQDVQIQMSLNDRTTGQKLLNGTSRVIILPKGASQFQEQDFAPVQYNFSGSYATVDRNTGDLLMAGSYTICYTLISRNGKGAESPLSEECINMDVEPLSPPQLISPADTSVVETKYPYFTWVPPAPLAMFSDLKYEILVVELRKGQTVYEAIQRNAPIFIQRYLNTPYLLYPSSSKALESGKKYAWQVIAKNGTMYAQKTEVWSFRLKSDSTSIVATGNLYPKLTKGYTAEAHTVGKSLSFEYNNETGDSLVAVQFYDLQSQPKRLVETQTLPIKPGQNFIIVKLKPGLYKNEQHYLIEIANNRNEYWNLKFKYVKDTSND